MCAEKSARVYLETVPCGVKLWSQKCLINFFCPSESTPLLSVVWDGVGSLRLSEQFLVYQTSSGPQQSLDKLPWGFQLQSFFQGLPSICKYICPSGCICAWNCAAFGAENGLILQSRYLAFTSVISGYLGLCTFLWGPTFLRKSVVSLINYHHWSGFYSLKAVCTALQVCCSCTFREAGCFFWVF